MNSEYYLVAGLSLKNVTGDVIDYNLKASHEKRWEFLKKVVELLEEFL